MPNWIATTLFVGLSLAAGAIGSVWTARSIPTWYLTLRKPSWNPPSWVFAPVWTALYVMMGLAAGIAWKHDPAGAWSVLFAVQLILNVAWSYFFFGLRRPDWAVVEIVALWLAIAATAWTMGTVDTTAGILMAPYLGWVSFAGILNAVVARLNPRKPTAHST